MWISELKILSRLSFITVRVGHRCPVIASYIWFGKEEARPAEKAKAGIISASEQPPLFYLFEWSEPDVEDDGQCVAVVTYLWLEISLIWRKQASLLPHCCRNICAEIFCAGGC